jgi:hypothetical protein
MLNQILRGLLILRGRWFMESAILRRLLHSDSTGCIYGSWKA